MSYELFTIPAFDRAVKRLRKKYHRIKVDLKRLVVEFEGNPFAGVAIPGYGQQVWKIRMASIDMRAGKRGGYRVIYALDQSEEAYLSQSGQSRCDRGGDREAVAEFGRFSL